MRRASPYWLVALVQVGPAGGREPPNIDHSTTTSQPHPPPRLHSSNNPPAPASSYSHNKGLQTEYSLRSRSAGSLSVLSHNPQEISPCHVFKQPLPLLMGVQPPSPTFPPWASKTFNRRAAPLPKTLSQIKEKLLRKITLDQVQSAYHLSLRQKGHMRVLA